MIRLLLSLTLIMITVNTYAATLESIRLSRNHNITRLVLDLSDSFAYNAFSLANPARLVIDLPKTQRYHQLHIPTLNKTPIRSIRYAEKKNDTLRIVLDLAKKLRYDAQALNPGNGHPHRLVIDLHDAYTSPVAANKHITPPITAKVASKPAAPPRILKTAKTLPRRDIIIAIDPGHGGQDSGAIGKYGTKEKDVVLAIGKRLAKLVNREPGMKAYMTRNRDVFIPLRQRIKRARRHNADMFISIHADAFRNTRASGSSVYVLSQRGASSEAAQILADRENAADLAGGISLEDKDDLLASVLLDLSQTASLEASLEVANTVLSGLKRVGHVHKKHVESAAFVVLKSPDIPSLLVETAFITNPREEKKLKSSSLQNKLAHAIMTGIRSYFRRYPPPGTQAQQQHIVSSGDTLSTIAQRYRVSMVDLKLSNNLTSKSLHVGDVLKIP